MVFLFYELEFTGNLGGNFSGDVNEKLGSYTGGVPFLHI